MVANDELLDKCRLNVHSGIIMETDTPLNTVLTLNKQLHSFYRQMANFQFQSIGINWLWNWDQFSIEGEFIDLKVMYLQP